MESAVDLSFFRRTTLLDTVTVVPDAEQPGPGKITSGLLEAWLGDICKAFVDTSGGKWGSLADDATRFFRNLTSGAKCRGPPTASW